MISIFFIMLASLISVSLECALLFAGEIFYNAKSRHQRTSQHSASQIFTASMTASRPQMTLQNSLFAVTILIMPGEVWPLTLKVDCEDGKQSTITHS